MPASYLAASDVMSSPVFAVGPSDTVSHAKNLMIRHRISRVLVIDGGRLAGVMTQKDIAYRLKQPEAAWKRRPPDRIPVREYMTGNPIVVSPEARLRSIAGTFVAKEISCVPVVDHTAVVGIVTKGDLMKSALVSDLKGTVGDVMEDAVTVNRWHSLAHVVTLMQERGGKLVVVNKDGSVAGILTETSLAIHGKNKRWPEDSGKPSTKDRKEYPGTERAGDYPSDVPATAGDVMTSPAIAIGPENTLVSAVRQMQDEQVNNLVVVENGSLAGILKRDDIIKEVAK